MKKRKNMGCQRIVEDLCKAKCGKIIKIRTTPKFPFFLFLSKFSFSHIPLSNSLKIL